MNNKITTILSLSCLLNSISMVSAQELNNQSLPVMMYEKTTEDVKVYDNPEINKSFEDFYKNYKEKIEKSGTDFMNKISINKSALNNDKDERILWIKENFIGKFYTEAGYIKHAMDSGITKKEAEISYNEIWENYTKRLKNLDMNVQEKEFVFNYNNIGFSNSINKYYKISEKCNIDRQLYSYCLKNRFNETHNDLFDNITAKCLTGNIKDFNVCRISIIKSDKFKKELYLQNYKVGYYLFAINKK